MSCAVSRYLLAAFLLLAVQLSARAATHDEVGKCGLTGIYKMRQSVLESPNYPDKYATGLCWDYVVRSPYRCPTKFHIQFLDFQLENSLNCTNDYLAIGFENNGDDMDLLCGQVIGIKKYHTPDGVLRLRFRTDDSPWTTDRGFKLLVTRLACERENLARENFNEVDDDTEQVDAPPMSLQVPADDRAVLFRNLSALNQYGFQPPIGAPAPPPYYPLQQFQFGYGIPNRLPVPAIPPLGVFYQPVAVTPQPSTKRPVIEVQNLDQPNATEKPCKNVDKSTAEQSPGYFNPLIVQQLPAYGEQYVYNAWPQQQQQLPTLLKAAEIPFGAQRALEQCCTSSFRQRRFYLSSPGFPRTAFTSLLPVSQRDCQFVLEKSSQTVCRLEIEFKFFDFGVQSSTICSGDYIAIDSERFCGCRTGFVYRTNWRRGDKIISMRMGQSGIPTSGFLLDITQVECTPADLQQIQQLGEVPIAQGLLQQQIPQQQLQQQQQNVLAFQQQPQGGQIPFAQGVLQQQQQPQQHFLGQQQFPLVSYPQTGVLQQQQPYYNPVQQQQQPFLYPEQLWSQTPPYQHSGLPIMPIQSTYPIRQYRQAKSLGTTLLDVSSAHQQPVTVVETNSTRKEYYYFDGDHPEIKAQDRTSDVGTDLDTDLEEYAEKQDLLRNRINSKLATPRYEDRCSFDMGAVLRLTIDTLWITKPTCFAPLRGWFSNVFG